MSLEISTVKRYDGPMSVKETERRFLSILGEYLVSLPFDLKVLQEAVTDPDLDRGAREIAAGAIVHTLMPQEGEGPLRYADDALLVRAAFASVAQHGGDAFQRFRERFPEIYDSLDDAVRVFEAELGDNWRWLAGKVETFPKLPYKGRRAAQYVEDDESQSFLYDEGLEFETNYNVSEEQVRNRLRRAEQVVDLLNRRRSEEARKIG
jgi:hypothetical protein